ncbi:MAG: NAD(P)-dependent oxidoreductase [Saprospiraceae bacterium]
MNSPRVLITDGVHPVLPKGLEKLGYQLTYLPDISLEEVHEVIHEYEGLVINSKILVGKELLDKALQLRWVGRLGSGLEIVDQAYAKTKNVAILSSPSGNAPAVGEHALAMLLALSNKLLAGDEQVRTMQWDREAVRGWELKYRTVGIIGYGHTGPAFAKTLRGFENPVIAYDKYKADFTNSTPWVTAARSPEEVLAKADVLSLHLPLTPETINYLDSETIASLKPGVIIVNTSRGKAIDLPALLEGLESGHIGGACLDVFPNEKTATYTTVERELYAQLTSYQNVVLSPHVAGWTVESKEALAQIVLDKVNRIISSPNS